VLLATVLALTAAVLHASWNLAVKSSGDRRMSLWGQFLIAGLMSAFILCTWFAWFEQPHIAWGWALVSGATHVPYLLLLSRAYDRGDFSMAYPIVRGSGALVSAFAGIAILGDHYSPTSIFGIAVAVCGLFLLGKSGSWYVIGASLSVAATIVVYSVVDGHGSRQSTGVAYALALNMFAAIITTAYIFITRKHDMVNTIRFNWKNMTLAAVASTTAYALVMIAYQHAPIGYVAALRESSVVIAALAGWKFLDEGDHNRRLSAAGIVLVGLVILVAGRTN
jgi:drug/metabolite transporter (DMT)-like permease